LCLLWFLLDNTTDIVGFVGQFLNRTTANYDEPWKEALSEYFEAFLCFFFPRVHRLIDWTKIPESLEKEVKGITALIEERRTLYAPTNHTTHGGRGATLAPIM
jgi:hypothetical protein